MVLINSYFRTLIILLLLILSLQNSISQSTSFCDPTLIPIQGKLGYQSFGNRCEGFYTLKVSGPPFAVAGLINGEFTYQLSKGEIIQVTVPEAQTTVNVQAVSLNTSFYRMDSRILEGSKLEWPVDDILLPGNITQNRVNIYGWLMSNNTKVYIPVKTKSTSSRTISDDNLNRLYIISTMDFKKVYWRIYKIENEAQTKPSKWEELPLKGNYAFRTLQITLPTSGKGDFFLEVTGLDLSNRRHINRFRIRTFY